MAIYHFSGTVIGRKQGRSAVGCAAYRAGEKLWDERANKFHDYTHKRDVVYATILAPKDTPEAMLDREKLWNLVEATEIRTDAQLAREFDFSLPKELSFEQNLQLAKEFVQEQFVNSGMIADLAIHADKKEDGFYYHAHVMLTMRSIQEDGFGQKVRAWNTKGRLLQWREAWAEYANRYLALNDIDQKIDHRTLESQNVPLEPQHKIGAKAAELKLARFEDHQRIAMENGERLLAQPEIALDAITKQQATFTHQDIARFVNRHTVDREQFDAVFTAVKTHKQIVALGKDDRQVERFTTQDMLKLETRMLNHTTKLAKCTSHRVSTVKADLALSQRHLSHEQTAVFQHLIEPTALKCVVGFAGTGKSYLLGAARDAWESMGYRVHGATLSGIAAETLEGSSGITSRTIASRAYYWNKGQEKLTVKDILVVDEAGMLGSRQMAQILHEVERGRAKLVLVGDPQQLQAIEAGAAFRAITEVVPAIELTEVRRQTLDWQKEATKELAHGQVREALTRYGKAAHIHECETLATAKSSLVTLWNDVRLNNPEQSQIMLAYTRADVKELNEMARDLRKAEGELGYEATISTERGLRQFSENDRIYFLKNDRDLGVMNGTLGTIERITEGELVVKLDQGNLGVEQRSQVVVNLNFYNQLEHGYAATIHKAQGVTVDRSYLLASKYLNAHATYVGMSRHRLSADIFYDKQEFANEAELFKSLGRDGSKDVVLDYLNAKPYTFNTELSPAIGKEHALAKVESLSVESLEQQTELMAFNPLSTRQTVAVVDPIAAIKANFESQYPEWARELRAGLGIKLEQNLFGSSGSIGQTPGCDHNHRVLNTTLATSQELAHEKAARIIEAKYDALDRALERGIYAPKAEPHRDLNNHEHHTAINNNKVPEHNKQLEVELTKTLEKDFEMSL